jgi:tetratricopeptide (TPR) repeat protein
MIKVVADIRDNSPEAASARPLAAAPATEGAQQPTIVVPMSAEDFDQRRRRSRTILIVCAVLVIAAVSWVYKRSTDPLRARESYDAGERLFKIARYPQAILSFDRAIALAPDYVDAYLLRARARAGLSDLAPAIEDFSAVIRLRPNDSQAYVERGLAYLDLKEYPLSLADCVKALALNPKLAAAYNLRGTLARAQGDPRGALEDFTRAVDLLPDLDNYYQRGATYQLMGEYRKALADFTQAIEFSPFSAQAYFARAEAERALGNEEAAKQDHLHGRILDGR